MKDTSLSQLMFAVQFRVEACNSAGCSAFSGYRSVMLASSGLELPLATPETPTNNQASKAQEPTP